MKRVKYIEESPVKQEIIFENPIDWSTFFDTRWRETFDLAEEIIKKETEETGRKYYPDIRYPDVFKKQKEIWKYQRLSINKNGTVRKPINPQWLHSPKARETQQKNFREYWDKRIEAKRASSSNLVCPICALKSNVVPVNPEKRFYACKECMLSFFIAIAQNPTEIEKNQSPGAVIGQDLGQGDTKASPQNGGKNE